MLHLTRFSAASRPDRQPARERTWALTYAWTIAPQRGDYMGAPAVLSYSGRDAGRVLLDPITHLDAQAEACINTMLDRYAEAGGTDLPVSLGVTVYVRGVTPEAARITYNAETGRPGMPGPIRPLPVPELAPDSILRTAVAAYLAAAVRED